MKGICHEIIQSFEDKNRHSPSPSSSTVDNSETTREMKSLLEVLVALRQREEGHMNKLSDSELVDSVLTFFIAGVDTTSISIAWTLYFLSTRPQLVANIREEVDLFFSQLSALEESNHGTNGTVSQFIYENLGKLSHCNAAFKEAIRIAQPASTLFMQSALTMPSELCNGVTVNPTDMLLLYTDSIMRDPTVFVNPLEYQPERWIHSNSSPEQMQQMERAFSLAFGAGVVLT